MTIHDKLAKVREYIDNLMWTIDHNEIKGIAHQLACDKEQELPKILTLLDEIAAEIPQARASKPELFNQAERDLYILQHGLEVIAKRPDLPNPDRDADWKNCQKWSSHDASQLLKLIPTISAALERATKPVLSPRPDVIAALKQHLTLMESGASHAALALAVKELEQLTKEEIKEHE